MSKSQVALVKGEDIQANVTRVFDLLGGVQNVIRPGTTVMIKPNAGHAEPPETSVCTNPEVVRAVIREVKKANPKEIVSISIVICICFFTDRFATFRDGGAMQVPKYYILAGICGILILGFTVYCITKIGPVMTASITVSVQLIVATLASHYGWLGLEHEPINWVKILGIAFLVAGVVLVKISIK